MYCPVLLMQYIQRWGRAVWFTRLTHPQASWFGSPAPPLKALHECNDHFLTLLASDGHLRKWLKAAIHLLWQLMANYRLDCRDSPSISWINRSPSPIWESWLKFIVLLWRRCWYYGGWVGTDWWQMSKWTTFETLAQPSSDWASFNIRRNQWNGME